MAPRDNAFDNATRLRKKFTRRNAEHVPLPYIAERWLERYTALLVTLGGLTLILAATLHPFNFDPVHDLSWQLMMQRLDLRLLRADSWIDIPRNVLLFMPFGLGIAALLYTTGIARRNRLVAAALVGLVTTMTVEGLQFTLQLRSPELSDLLANTAGMLVGALAYERWLAINLSRRYGRPFGMRDQVLLLLLPAVALVMTLTFGLFRDVQHQSDLTNWDSAYYLAIGNEITQDRPWHGQVDELIVLDRGAQDDELTTFLQAAQSPTPAPTAAIAHYCLVCAEPLHDFAGNAPDLVWQASHVHGEASEQQTAGTVRWLETSTPATRLSTRIATTSEFSVLVALHPAATPQSGPARIITLSKDVSNRNLTIGQEGDALVIRLRTLGTGNNGLRPEFRVPGIFIDTAPHRIAVTYSSSILRVYVDSLERVYTARLAPEIAVVSKLIPINNWHVAMRASSLAVYSGIYYLLLIELALSIGLIPLAWATRTVAVGRRASPLS